MSKPAIKACVCASVDAHCGAHAITQGWIIRPNRQSYAYRDTLDDLDPITGGILRRQ